MKKFNVDIALSHTMSAQEEQQVAFAICEKLKYILGFRLDDENDEDDGTDHIATPLDILAMAKHLQNIATFAANMLTNDALHQVKDLIDLGSPDDKGAYMEVNKQFVYNSNKWMYQLKETYDQLGYQHVSDGSLDINSQSYRALEAQQEQLKRDSKALTAQMAGLKARILNDHPKLQPSDIVVNLALKGQA